MTAIDDLLAGGVQDLERRHDLAGSVHLDLERAAGQLLDALGEES